MSLPHDTVVALLDELDLFEALADDEIDALAHKVDTVSWEAGTIIFEEGDRGDACYVIHSGRVKVMRRLVDGQPITLAQLGHGAIVGELALFASDRRSATLQAVDPTAAIAISREDLMAILHGNAEAAISMAVHVAGLLQRAEDRRVRERDLDRQRSHPVDAARPGRGATGPPARGRGARARGQHERPRATGRSAEG